MSFRAPLLALSKCLALPAALLLLVGCSGDDSTATSAVTPEMSHDFNHDHEHTHGPEHDHGHSHKGDKNGTHRHPHSHTHRHGKSPHEGRIVSIGHTHHKDGETYYHAEVLPIEEGMLRFHVLIEDADGELQEQPVEAAEILAIVKASDTDAELATHVTFARSSSDNSLFAVEVPDAMASAERLNVVVPKIQLGKGRLHFKFESRRAELTADTTTSN